MNNLKFTVPSQKRTITVSPKFEADRNFNERFFLLFPKMEFSVEYEQKNNSIILYCPHYELNYIYNNKKYTPKLPNNVYYQDKLKFCSNGEVYDEPKYFNNEKELKNYIINNFYNSTFILNTICDNVTFSPADLKAMFQIWQTRNELSSELLDFISIDEKDWIYYARKRT